MVFAEGIMAIGLSAYCVEHHINLAGLQRDLCQNLDEHQPSFLLEIQIWSGVMILQTQQIRVECNWYHQGKVVDSQVSDFTL